MPYTNVISGTMAADGEACKTMNTGSPNHSALGEAHDDAGQHSAQAGKQHAHDKRGDRLAVGVQERPVGEHLTESRHRLAEAGERGADRHPASPLPEA